MLGRLHHSSRRGHGVELAGVGAQVLELSQDLSEGGSHPGLGIPTVLDELGEGQRYVWEDRKLEVLRKHLAHDLLVALVEERDGRSDHLPEDHSETVDVHLFIVLKTSHHLRSHVGKGAAQLEVASTFRDGKAEIANLDGVAGVHKKIGGLQVSMDDSWFEAVKVVHASSSVHRHCEAIDRNLLVVDHVEQRPLSHELSHNAQVRVRETSSHEQHQIGMS